MKKLTRQDNSHPNLTSDKPLLFFAIEMPAALDLRAPPPVQILEVPFMSVDRNDLPPTYAHQPT